MGFSAVQVSVPPGSQLWGKMPDDVDGPDPAEVLMEFLNAPGGSAQERILRAHPELLSKHFDDILVKLAAKARTEDPSWVATIEQSREYLARRRSGREQDLFPSDSVVLAVPEELAAAWEALTQNDGLTLTELIDRHPELTGQQFGDLIRGARAEAQAVGDYAVATWLQSWLNNFDRYRVAIAAIAVHQVTGTEIDDAVLQGMDGLLAAPDWASCHSIISENPLLLTDQADVLCRMLLQVTRALGDETLVATYYQNWKFLRSCRSHGLIIGIASYTGWTGVVPNDLAALYAAVRDKVSSVLQSNDPADTQTALTEAERLLSHPDGHSFPQAFMASALILGGLALMRTAELAHDTAAAGAAIERLEEAQAHLPDGAPEHLECLANLGSALKLRFGWTSDLGDLRRAETCFASAADLATPFSNQRQQLMDAARELLMDLTMRTGEIELLDGLIELQSEDLHYGRPTPAHKADSALTLCFSLERRYDLTGDQAALTAMIDTTANTADEVGLVPERPWLLGKAGFGLLRRYGESGNPADLDRCLVLLQAAIDAAEPGSVEYSVSLDFLGCALRDRYTKSGHRADLDQAIELAERAAQNAAGFPEGTPFYPTNLGNALIDRYRATGDEQDLNRAIEVFERGASVTSDETELDTRLSCLALGLMVRHHRTGDITDLDSAIGLLRRTLDVLPDRSTNRFKILISMAMALGERYDLLGDPADLDQAVAMCESVVAEESPHAALHAGHLGNLAVSLMRRWHSPNRNLDDQEAAIRAWEKSITLTEPDSEWHMRLASNLAGALTERAANKGQGGQPDDLTRAIDMLTPIVQATPQGTPEWAARMGNLASAFRFYSEISDARNYADQAVSTYRLACSAGVGAAPGNALELSQMWADWAMTRQAWDEAADAARYGLEAMRHLFRAQLGRSEKETWLRKATELTPLAAYAAAAAGNVRGAVATFESGRALILSEILELDAANVLSLTVDGHDALASRYRSAASRWQELSQHPERLDSGAGYRDSGIVAHTYEPVRESPGLPLLAT